MPIPVAERSKARVYGRSLAGIAGLNPTKSCMSVSFECVCCQVEGAAMGRSLVQRSPTDCGVSLKNKAALARVGLLRQNKLWLVYKLHIRGTCFMSPGKGTNIFLFQNVWDVSWPRPVFYTKRTGEGHFL